MSNCSNTKVAKHPKKQPNPIYTLLLYPDTNCLILPPGSLTWKLHKF